MYHTLCLHAVLLVSVLLVSVSAIDYSTCVTEFEVIKDGCQEGQTIPSEDGCNTCKCVNCRLICNTRPCPDQDGPACSPPWFRINDQCFLLVGAAYPNKADWRNWAAASDYCRTQAPGAGGVVAHPRAPRPPPQSTGGADLAQPKPYNIEPLSDYIKSMGYSDSWDTFWLAGSDFNQKVVRRWWSDGTNITTGWQRGEPNGDNGEDCLGIGPMGADSLIDMGCEGVWPFVCEA